MKKLVLTIAIVLGMTYGASAQVFLTEGNDNQRNSATEFNIDNPGFGHGTDYYSPIGSGTLLLAGLAGAYLISKKRKK